jgi:hypothetical protein
MFMTRHVSRTSRRPCSASRSIVSHALIALAMFILAPRASHAQSRTLSPALAAQRRLLLDEAQSARAAGDHVQALDRAQRAGEIEMTPSLRQFLAAEQRTLNHYVDALQNAALCVTEAVNDPNTPDRDRLIEVCRTLSEDVRRRSGAIVIHPPNPAPDGLRIEAGGREVPHALWSLAFTVDPGPVEIVATAPGYETLRHQVQVDSGQHVGVPITLTPAPEAPAHNATQPEQRANPRPARSTTPAVRPSISPLLWTGLAIGAVSAGAALAFFFTGDAAYHGYETDCGLNPIAIGDSGCSSRYTSTQQQLAVDTVVVNILWGVAAVGAVVAIIGVVASVPHAPRTDRAHVRLNARGATLGIAF